MNDFRSYRDDPEQFAKAFESIQMTLKEKSNLGQLYASKLGVPVTRGQNNQVRGETVYSCSKIGGYLIAHFKGVGPRDKMMWVGFIEPQRDGSEQWLMRPEVRLAIKRLGWF